MKDIKKLMITLVALLAVTTGAWADGIVCTASDLGKVLCTDGSIYENVSAATNAGKTAAAVIAYVDETNKNGLALALADESGTKDYKSAGPACSGKTAVTGGTWRLPSIKDWQYMFIGCGASGSYSDNPGAMSYSGLASKLTTAQGNALQTVEYWSSTESSPGSTAWIVKFDGSNASFNYKPEFFVYRVRACLAFDIAAPAVEVTSGPEVDWNKTSKTGTFTMPGGNVTLEPEYYPQAALTEAPTAINDVPATTDGAIVKAGTVANIGSTETAQGTVMYYVSQTALDDAALLALAADQWTADVPTAEKLTKGQAYVYYYVRGNDSDTDEENFSDGDILAANALTVTIAAEPTYAVTFAEGTDPNEWTASPAADVKKGQTVTVTYTGSKKVIGVKAEKKSAAAAPRPLAEAVAADLGKIAGADGNIYDTKAAAEAVATGNAVAMIAYVGSASDCTHGLAIALADESGTKTWSGAGAACSGKTAVTGGTWRLPSIKDWQYMLIGCGASESYKDNPSTMGYSGLASKLTTAQGNALVQTVSYWSSTESSPGEDAWSLYFGGSSASFFSGDYEGDAYPIRACLAF